ncbi:hypothetical protein J5X84_00335 [Streptosporangiaceae bacterium NEAU-GS5]|nr:hypothetical protein [Streptosporangiaceae bacterium NEAU-GS5]
MLIRRISAILLSGALGGSLLLAGGPAGATSGQAAATKPLHLRGGLTLHIPVKWNVYLTAKDWTQVVTGKCDYSGRYFGPPCRSFWILGPKALKAGTEGFAYTPAHAFYPANDVEPCPTSRKLYQHIDNAATKGLRPVGKGHKAYYRDYVARCTTAGGETKTYFSQREWYLPKTKILVVDQWATDNLDVILKHATWS